ncbi:MAG: serine/threonine protein kinase [Nitrosopumilaceae archaeon]
MKQSFLPIKKTVDEPYSKILGYPKATKRQLDSRVSELKKLGITHISFQGKTKIGTLDVLGKGYVGVVVLAKKRNRVVALKIRRFDSQREGMENEAKLLREANKVGVGPSLFDSSKNFLVMEFLDGEKIGDWINSLSGKGSVSKIKSVIRRVMEDCYNLDQVGFDHGELSSIVKHVIVGKKICMIDFESSSTERRVANVTSATQGIFIGSGISKRVQRLYKIPPKDQIIEALRNYKKEQTRKSFERLLKVLKLENVC